MKKTRFLSLILVFAMLCLALTGCGSTAASTSEAASAAASAEASTEAEAAPAEEAAEPAAEEAPAAAEEASAAEPASAAEEEAPVEHEPVTLPICEEATTYTMWTTLHPAYMNYVTDLADLTVWKTIQERTNIGFEFTAVSGITASDSFNLMMAGGDYCDVITEMDLFSDGIEAAIDEEIIQDVSEKVPELAPTYWDVICSDPSAYMTMVTESGYVGAIASTRGETGSTDLNGPMVRGDWIEEMGIDYPTTLTELEDYLQKCLDTYGATSEFSADGMSGVLLTAMNLSADYMVKDGVVSATYTDENFRTYLETAADWYNKGLIDHEFYTVEDNTENATKVANGLYSLCTNSAQGITRIASWATDPDASLDLEPIAYPAADFVDEIHVGEESSLVIDDDCWAFSTSCEDVDPLLTLVEYMYSDEGQLLYNYGVEGEEYTLDADGNPQWTEMITSDPNNAFDVQEYLYATATVPGVRDYARELWNASDAELKCVEIFSNPGDCAWTYPDYAIMTTDDATAYAALDSDLDTYVESTVLAFITGQTELTDATWEDFQNTLNEMGIEEMVQYKQNAYDSAMEKLASL